MRSRFGSFYGPGGNTALGVGTIYSKVRYALYSQKSRLFGTVAGPVYVLTHECDVDQDNVREFNDRVLVCPLHPLETFSVRYAATTSEDRLIDFVANIASDKVSRVAYFPPLSDLLPFGGLLYLNDITNTHVVEFDQPEAKQVAVLSETAQQGIDWKLQHHLLRPKVEPLPKF